MNMRKKILFSLILLASLLYSSFAKNISIKIMDKDIQIPLEGVMVSSTLFTDPHYSDAEGVVNIAIDASVDRIILTCTLIGYETKKVNVKEFDKEVLVEMSIEGVVESDELVIEESYYNKKEKVGATWVVDKEELKNMAMRGQLEDVMSSIKSLPGISYSSSFFTQLSVRGGNASEVSASLDGFLVRYPFYWGGGATIFNPNIVESVQFSNGAFSVKNGLTMSGLIEVETIKPNEGFKIYSKLDISSFETYIQLPLNRTKTAGLLFGGRVTYLEATFAQFMKASGQYVPTSPYIRESNIKFYWNPNPYFEWYINGFFGADGVGIGTDSSGPNLPEPFKSNITTNTLLLYNQLHAIGTTGFKITPNKSVFIHLLAGYEFYNSNVYSNITQKGTQDYSSNFKLLFPDVTTDSFTVDISEGGNQHNYTHSFQTKIDTDIQLHDKVIMSFGAGLIYDYNQQSNRGNIYTMDFTDATPDYINNNYNLDADDMSQLSTFTYINFNFLPIPNKLKIDLGIRVDHFISISGSNTINTYPAVNPRFYIAYTPFRHLKYLDYLTFSLGVGLYSKLPSQIPFQGKFPIKDFGIKQQKVLTTVLGVEAQLPLGFKITLEGYYKYYFDRYYYNMVSNGTETVFKNHSDGYGHAAGFDIIVKRKLSRYIDGFISYSFVFARYMQPTADPAYPGGPNLKTDYMGEPLNTWYYPDYHRWHTMNIVLNIRPTPWLTISPGFTLTSGLPKKDLIGSTDPVKVTNNGEILELYIRDQVYSDTSRTQVSVPFDLKVAFNFYFPKSKVRFEAYISMEDIFSYIYKPDAKAELNRFTGKEIVIPQSYSFPYPVFGVKISY